MAAAPSVYANLPQTTGQGETKINIGKTAATSKHAKDVFC